MRVKALTNFSGAISMAKGEERDIENNVLLQDLLQAGYVKLLESSEDKEPESEAPTDEESESEDKEPESETSTDEESESEDKEPNKTPEIATSQKQTSKRSVKPNESKRAD